VRMENLVGGLPFDGVVTVLEPKQAGGGEAAPDNIRPISGWTGTKLVRAGKNLMPKQTFNGIFVSNGDGVYSLAANNTGASAVIKFPFKAGVNYTLSVTTISGASLKPCIIVRDPDDSGMYCSNYTDASQPVTVRFENDTEWNVLLQTGSEAGHAVYGDKWVLQIEIGETATEYEPYQGLNLSADFGQTVYGGRLDWQKGVLKADKAIVAFNGTEAAWVRHDASGLMYINALQNPELPVQGQGSPYGVCSHYRRTTANNYFDMEDGEFATGMHQFSSITAYAIFKDAKNGASVDAWKAYLAGQYAAGTPVQVVYKLAAPVEIPLTPQEIKQLEGINTLYGDAGIAVNGRENLHAALVAGIRALEAKFAE